ncbi:hypothetical protein Tco_0549651 [Tanacetum coccineum]
MDLAAIGRASPQYTVPWLHPSNQQSSTVLLCVMDRHDDVVFMIHYNGVFKYDPLRKKHAGNIFVKEIVVWTEDEADYPYFRSPPLKSRPWLGMDGATSDTIEETKPFHASLPAINHVITCKTCLKWSTCFVKEELYTKMSSKNAQSKRSRYKVKGLEFHRSALKI